MQEGGEICETPPPSFAIKPDTDQSPGLSINM